MKKQNQIRKNGKTASRSAQQNRAARTFELSISTRRKELLLELAKESNCDPTLISRNAIRSYLDFVDKFPDTAQAQARYTKCDATLMWAPQDDLFDRLTMMCEVFHFDHASICDLAIGVFIDLTLKKAKFSQSLRDLHVKERGKMDPEAIFCMLSKLSDEARSFFARIAGNFVDQPFRVACRDLADLREIVMHHPGLVDETRTLEMIVEGSHRLAWLRELEQDPAADIPNAWSGARPHSGVQKGIVQ